jgi:DnaD/phage-associated family protein
MRPHELGKLTEYLRKGLPGDCLRHGIELAVENGSANMRYISAIYDRWLEQGLRSLADILADEERHRKVRSRDSPEEGQTIIREVRGGVVTERRLADR